VTPSSLARAIRYAKARQEVLAELKAARRETEEKSLALDALNRQKAFLFSIIAHDLRNPFQATDRSASSSRGRVAMRSVSWTRSLSAGCRGAGHQRNPASQVVC
jgi:hypothetical protein